MDIPAEHLNLFKTNPSLDLNSLSLVVKGTFVVWIFPLQYSPYSVVYDPTAFMACKLVIVAWLKAYGATMKLRAPCGTAATWWRCLARAGIKVVDQVPLPSYTAIPLLLQIISLEMFRCSNGKSTIGWWHSVLSRYVRGGGFGGRKYDMVLVYMKDGCGQGRESERRAVRKVSLGSRERLRRPEWTSCPSSCV